MIEIDKILLATYKGCLKPVITFEGDKNSVAGTQEYMSTYAAVVIDFHIAFTRVADKLIAQYPEKENRIKNAIDQLRIEMINDFSPNSY